METIENRAKEKYCANCGARTEYNCSPESTPCSYVKDYIKIATEQKKIDIEKACEWWYIKLNALYPNDLLGAVVDDFRKAMEE